MINKRKKDGKSMADRIINGFLFQNEDDEDYAREELNKIQYISDKLTDDPEAVLAVYNKMIDSKLFITPVGYDYLKSLQDYLIKSPAVPDDRINAIPVMISYKEALRFKEVEQKLREATEEIEKLKGEAMENPAPRIEYPETPVEKLHRKYRFSIITIVVLSAVIIALFVIALRSNTPNILNYRYEIENEYAEWAQELSEKEIELNERENELNELSGK